MNRLENCQKSNMFEFICSFRVIYLRTYYCDNLRVGALGGGFWKVFKLVWLHLTLWLFFCQLLLHFRTSVGCFGNSLLYFLITPLCVKVNCNVSLQLTFTQLGVKFNSKQNGVNFYTKWCNTRLLVATANIAEATACLVTRRSLHGPGSNFCHPPAHGVEICFV